MHIISYWQLDRYKTNVFSCTGYEPVANDHPRDRAQSGPRPLQVGKLHYGALLQGYNNSPHIDTRQWLKYKH